MSSPFATIYEAILTQVKTTVPEIREIEQDLGQLENYETRPPVSFPCLLIDMGQFNFDDMGGRNQQHADGQIVLRLADLAWSNSNSLTPAKIRAQALRFYEIEQKLHVALHGWRNTGFSKLLRRSSVPEQRNDTNIRVRIITYATSFEDDTTAPVYTTITTPEPTVGVGANNGG